MITINNRKHSDGAQLYKNLLYFESLNLSSSTPCELHTMYAVSNNHAEIWPSTLVWIIQLCSFDLKMQNEYLNTGLM